jgi:hypothetical protein
MVQVDLCYRALGCALFFLILTHNDLSARSPNIMAVAKAGCCDVCARDPIFDELKTKQLDTGMQLVIVQRLTAPTKNPSLLWRVLFISELDDPHGIGRAPDNSVVLNKKTDIDANSGRP